MDILGIGPMELLVVLVLALIVLGPRQLPEAARKLGKLVRDLRGMWTEVSADFARELNMDEAMGDIRSVTDVVNTLRRAPSPTALLMDEITASTSAPASQPSGAQAQEGGNGNPSDA